MFIWRIFRSLVFEFRTQNDGIEKENVKNKNVQHWKPSTTSTFTYSMFEVLMGEKDSLMSLPADVRQCRAVQKDFLIIYTCKLLCTFQLQNIWFIFPFPIQLWWQAAPPNKMQHNKHTCRVEESSAGWPSSGRSRKWKVNRSTKIIIIIIIAAPKFP